MSSRAERVLIGLGGNIGDPLAAMQSALGKFDRDEDCRVTAVSSVWQTPPWGVTDQPDFLNACAAITTRLQPRAFLDLCLAIEHDLKRVRNLRWGPRSIDIDILFFGDCAIQDPGLTVPHPRICERAFVLVPLAEIAPQTVLDGVPIAAHAATANQTGMIKAKGPDWYPVLR